MHVLQVVLIVNVLTYVNLLIEQACCAHYYIVDKISACIVQGRGIC